MNTSEIECANEYCCPKCGLIFVSENTKCDEITCPECGNYKKDIGVIPVNSLIYTFSHEEIEENLKRIEKKLHYAKNRPINYK